MVYKIKSFEKGNWSNWDWRKSSVLYDEEYKEYIVTFNTGSDYWFKDDYFTTDYEDAVSTALYFCEN